jgi:putative transposase
MTRNPDRQEIIELVNQAMNDGASQSQACSKLGLSVRTLQRWKKQGMLGQDRRVDAPRKARANALSEEERDRIVQVCNEPQFASKSPTQIVPLLANQGIYYASESSFYRVLKAHGQQHHRGKARAPKSRPKATHHASKPGQVWVWDITWLPTKIKGLFYRLYIIMDLFSRKIIAWEVWEEENDQHAQDLLRKATLSEGIQIDQGLVLHGDNGSPLKSANLQALLLWLGIAGSYSRPRVSNDNAHAESLFRTLKYHPSLPEKPFHNISAAREWTHRFVQWYNCEHLHSSLNFVTPAQKHAQQDLAVLNSRKCLYEHARAQNPLRWIQRKTRNWSPVNITTLNPDNTRLTEQILKKSA